MRFNQSLLLFVRGDLAVLDKVLLVAVCIATVRKFGVSPSHKWSLTTTLKRANASSFYLQRSRRGCSSPKTGRHEEGCTSRRLLRHPPKSKQNRSRAVVLLQPKCAFTALFECGRLQGSNQMLHGGFRSLFDECQSTVAAEFDVTDLQHEDAKMCVILCSSRRLLQLTSAKASSNGSGLLPSTWWYHRRFLMTSSFRSCTSVYPRLKMRARSSG